MTIWKKNFLYTIFIIMLTVTVSMGVLYVYMPIYYQHKQEKLADKSVEKLKIRYNNKPLAYILEDLKKSTISPNSTVYNYVLEDEKKEILYQTIDPSMIIKSDDQDTTVVVEWANDAAIFKSFVDDKDNLYTLTAYIFNDEITNASQVLLDLYPYILILAFIIGIFSAYVYSINSSKRIRKLAEVTTYMLTIDSNYYCEIRGNDEISSLAQNINHLNQTLVRTIEELKVEVNKREESEQYKAYFFQSAAHELKTPVTIMSGIIEGMLLNVGRYKDRDKYLEICQQLLTNQTELILKLSDVYRVDTPLTSENTNEIFPLNELIDNQLPHIRLIGETTCVQVMSKLEPYNITANYESIILVISNILTNAIQYSDPDTLVNVTLSKGLLTVENQCTPLSDSDLINIFKPFYRPDYSRNKKDGGTGLGLYIVGLILETYEYRYSFYPTNHSMIFEIDFKK